MRPQFVSVKSDGTAAGTHVLVNGQKIECRSITLKAEASSLVTVMLEVCVDRIEMEGMMLVTERHTMTPSAAEFQKDLEKLHRVASQMSPSDLEALLKSIGQRKA